MQGTVLRNAPPIDHRAAQRAEILDHYARIRPIEARMPAANAPCPNAQDAFRRPPYVEWQGQLPLLHGTIFVTQDQSQHRLLRKHPLIGGAAHTPRSEEHTSELQSLMRISSDVFCLKKTNIKTNHNQ